MANRTEYTLKSKYMKGTEILGFEVVGTDDKIKVLKISDIHKLIQLGQIKDCRLVEKEGINHIISEGTRIADLPILNRDKGTKTKYTITARIFKEESLVGYVVYDGEKTYRLSPDQVWEKAKQEEFTNITAYTIKDKKAIRGIGISLIDIEKIKI